MEAEEDTINVIVNLSYVSETRRERLIELLLTTDEGIGCTYTVIRPSGREPHQLSSLLLDLVSNKSARLELLASKDLKDYPQDLLEIGSNELPRRFIARCSWRVENFMFIDLLNRFNEFVYLGDGATPLGHGWLNTVVTEGRSSDMPVLSAPRKLTINGKYVPCGWQRTGWYNGEVIRKLPWHILTTQREANPWFSRYDDKLSEIGPAFCLNTPHMSVFDTPFDFLTLYLYFKEKFGVNDLDRWAAAVNKSRSGAVMQTEPDDPSESWNPEKNLSTGLLINDKEHLTRSILKSLYRKKPQMKLANPKGEDSLPSHNIPLSAPKWNYIANNQLRFTMGDLKDRFKGERCFLIGNGPSLNKTDLTRLSGEYTFGLNRIYLNYQKMSFQTTFLCVTNMNVLEQFYCDIDSLDSIKFLNYKSRNLIYNKWNAFFLESRGLHKFELNLNDGFWCEGSTVTYCAMQVAYYMGFSRVILVGVDHGFVNSGTPHKLVTAEGPDENHFHPDYFGKGTKWQYPDLAGSEVSYRVAKSVYENDGRKIFDATVGGKLQIFEKVDLDHALTL
jgi:hypothetical protein